VLTLPKAARIFPAFTSRPPGSDVKVTNPSSSSTPDSPNERKKSARAYGSTAAWNEASVSRISNAFDGSTGFLPPTPRKLPITAISGLNTLDDDTALPAPIGLTGSDA
jgi:hypothetical protein